MDSLTQATLGAAVGEAVLGKKTGNKAAVIGAIIGTIPDLDVLANFFTDTITAIEWHRGFSHSILFAVLMSPLFGAVINKLERRLNLGWQSWSKLFFWGLFTHPLLDAFTTWGTRLFWPFDVRLAFNSIFVIDPFYTLPFLACTLLTLFYRRDAKIRRRINLFGLFLSTAYLFSTLITKGIINKRFESALNEQGIGFKKISTRPAPLSTILWNANIETEDAYLIGDYSFFDTEPIRFTSYPKNREVAKSMMSYQNVKRLIAIAEGWYILEKKQNKWYFYDLRFGLIPQKNGPSFFAFSYELKNESGTIIAEENRKTGRDANYLLQVLWARIKGHHL